MVLEKRAPSTFFMIAAVRFVLAVSAVVLAFSSCAHRPPEPVVTDPTPLDKKLEQFTSVQNRLKFEELRPFFAKDATVQSPITPRPVSADTYLKALAVEPFGLQFTNTEMVYGFPTRAVTRSDVVAGAPGKFNLKERVTVDWRLEDGSWRIARIVYPAWSSLLGTYRRGGLRNEGSLELRLMPGGKYTVYTAENFSAPEYRGDYVVDGNRLTLTDTGANEPRNFQGGAGVYVLTRTSTGMNFQKVAEDNTWRDERFEGLWMIAR